ncbi:MarC family protein [Verrucomicrobium sp. BvORR034]|jgi:MarC family membrane protein|uniref:MarC family protein n=1 Tax=Verrucomicrobium sp. BvORR034 TaxID=1396418 RepID=UPI000678C92A|nr:MarC family protein [Verrucomicrobium sp. BvORR034]
MRPTDWISALVLLLIVLDPLGNVPVFSSLLRQVEPARRKRVILRECGIALVVLFFFLAFGGGFLKLVGLSQSSLGIAGSIILFMIALRMVFESTEKVFGGLPQGEPFIVPMAIPMLAGPSALATVILFTTREGVSTLGAVGAISIAMGVTCIVLLLGERIIRLVGERGLAAMERLMGLLLTAIAVEMFLRGVKEFMK